MFRTSQCTKHLKYYSSVGLILKQENLNIINFLVQVQCSFGGIVYHMLPQGQKDILKSMVVDKYKIVKSIRGQFITFS